MLWFEDSVEEGSHEERAVEASADHDSPVVSKTKERDLFGCFDSLESLVEQTGGSG